MQSTYAITLVLVSVSMSIAAQNAGSSSAACDPAKAFCWAKAKCTLAGSAGLQKAHRIRTLTSASPCVVSSGSAFVSCRKLLVWTIGSICCRSHNGMTNTSRLTGSFTLGSRALCIPMNSTVGIEQFIGSLIPGQMPGRTGVLGSSMSNCVRTGGG